MDSNGWHPRLRVKDQTNIDRMLAAVHLNTPMGGRDRPRSLGIQHMDLLAAAQFLLRTNQLVMTVVVSQSSYARQSPDQTRRHVIAEEGEDSWNVVESVAIYDKSIRGCRCKQTNRNAVGNALRSGLSSAFNLIRDDYRAQKRV